MFSLIVAIDKNNCMGKNGKMPWKIKGEQLRFKNLTMGKSVVMGRTSYEELSGPLPNRMNLVVSTTKTFKGKNLDTITNLDEFIEKNKSSQEEIFIAGGAKVFEKFINLANKIYLTVVDYEVEDGDTFFPNIDYNNYVVTYKEKVLSNINFTYYTLEKKK